MENLNGIIFFYSKKGEGMENLKGIIFFYSNETNRKAGEFVLALNVSKNTNCNHSNDRKLKSHPEIKNNLLSV